MIMNFNLISNVNIDFVFIKIIHKLLFLVSFIEQFKQFYFIICNNTNNSQYIVIDNQYFYLNYSFAIIQFFSFSIFLI